MMTKITKAEREEMAGPRPPERIGYILYAQLIHYTLESRYVWVYRRTRCVWPYRQMWRRHAPNKIHA